MRAGWYKVFTVFSHPPIHFFWEKIPVAAVTGIQISFEEVMDFPKYIAGFFEFEAEFEVHHNLLCLTAYHGL